jgi:hypothetical protein
VCSDFSHDRYSSVLTRSLVCAALVLVAVPSLAQTLAGGLNHTVMLKSDGTVWTVGANNYGQLGDNSTTVKTSPVHHLEMRIEVSRVRGSREIPLHRALAPTSRRQFWESKC